jgi:hypothetical protein
VARATSEEKACPRVRFTRFLCLGLVVVLLAGCGSPVRTFSEADQTADFSQIRTYAWRGEGTVGEPLGGAASPGMTALTLQAIRNAVDAELARRGLRRGDPADILVDLRAGTRERLQTTFWARDPFYDRRFGPYPVSPLTDRRTVTTVEENLVAVDMFDARTGRAIWSGIGATPLALSADDGQAIDEVVGAVLSDFPPQSTP